MRIILTLLLTFLLAVPAHSEDFRDYLDKSYVGWEYSEALNSNRPLALIFADPKDIGAILRFLPVGEMLVREFDGKYNCTILSIKDSYNKRLARAFGAKKFPALFLIDTQTKTYVAVDEKDYTRDGLKAVLYEYLERDY